MDNKPDKQEEITPSQVEDLVQRAQNGEVDCFAKLYDHYVNKVYRYIYYRCDKAEALDITETVFLKSWENLRGYHRKEGSSFTSWIFRIAHNLIVDHHRYARETVEIDDTMADHKKENDPVALTENTISGDVLRSALAQLKKPYQEVLVLHYLNDIGNQELARILKKSEGGLRVLKFRALQELKKVLKEMGIKHQ